MHHDATRRKALAAFGTIGASLVMRARAQPASLPTIGFLNAASATRFAHVVDAFRSGLKETGHVEDRDVRIAYRWADDQYDRLPALAAELARLRVSVIATGSSLAAAKAARAATTTIPIVFLTGANPVKAGLVADLAHPGGNITGITTLNVDLGPKRLEVLHELIPSATDIGVLLNPTNDPGYVDDTVRSAQAAALALKVQVHMLHARSRREIEQGFSGLAQRRAGGLVITADTFFSGNSQYLAAMASKYGIPTVSPYRDFIDAGGLMSYGGNIIDQYRLVGVYTGRVLKGEKPADLPVHQVTNVELCISVKAATALGLTVPQSLLLRADTVIR